MHYIFLEWKNFNVNLEKVNIYLKAQLSSDYDGLLCNDDGVKVVFLNSVQEEDENKTNSYWNSLNSNSFNPTLQEVITNKVKAAQDFGYQAILDFAVSNVTAGITQAGKTRAVADYLRPLQRYMEQGSLYAAIEQINEYVAAGIPEALAPFVTTEKLEAAKLKIQGFLSS